MRSARAARRDQWDHTCNLLALLINVNRDPAKSSAVTADEIHPYREDATAALTVEEKNAHLRDQMETLKIRAFGGVVKYIAPFTPIPAQRIPHGKS
jgi:hypothetical protein